MKKAKTINKTISLFEQDLDRVPEIKLNLINTAISEYFDGKPISIKERRPTLKQNGGVKEFYFRDELIISVVDGFTFDGNCYIIEYSINNDK